MKSVASAALATLLLATAGTAYAADFKAGDIVVQDPWARASAIAGRNGAAYMMLSNNGNADDQLVSASASIAGKTELHTHIVEGNVMKMRPVAGIEVAPGSPTELKPGGLHVMLLDLKQPLKEGENFTLSLTFSKAGKVDVPVKILGPGAMSPGGHGAHHGSGHSGGHK